MPGSEEDPRVADAEQEVSQGLRELAANIMRVTRGAGRAYELGHQAQAFVDALNSYRAVKGHYPASDTLDRMLTIAAKPTRPEPADEELRTEQHAAQLAIRAAVQITASRLLDQHLKEVGAEQELLEALRAGERFRKRQLEREEAERRRQIAEDIQQRLRRQAERKERRTKRKD